MSAMRLFGRNKFNAKKTEFDGIMFASRAEAARYQLLKLMEKAGQISDLTLQPRFELVPVVVLPDGSKQRPISYVGDFMYRENGHTVVEDVKGFKTPEFILKAKMFRHKFPGLELRITR